MRRYSAFAIAREAARYHSGWERAWASPNTGRNTTIIRSNYLQDASAAIFEKSRALYEDLSQELNFNIMFSPRGVLMLAQTEHELRAWKRTAHANRLAGIESEMVDPAGVKRHCPIINLDGPRYPVLGGLWQARGGTARHDAVAWGYARARSVATSSALLWQVRPVFWQIWRVSDYPLNRWRFRRWSLNR